MIKLGCIDQREHFKHEASDLKGNLWEERGGKGGESRTGGGELELVCT